MNSINTIFPPVVLERDGFTLRGEFKYLPFDPERFENCASLMVDDQAPTHTLELNYKIYKDGDLVAPKTSLSMEPDRGDEHFIMNPFHNQCGYDEWVDFMKEGQVRTAALLLRRTANYYKSQENNA